MKKKRKVDRSRSSINSQRKSRPSRSASSKVSALYKSVNFKSTDSIKKGLAAISLNDKNTTELVDQAYKESRKKGKMMVQGMLKVISTTENRKVAKASLDALLKWTMAPIPKPADRRRLVLEAFRIPDGGVILAHGISRLPNDQAREMMSTYFKEGGQMEPIVRWLELAGRALLEMTQKKVVKGIHAKALLKSIQEKAMKGGRAKFDLFGSISDAGSAFVDLVKDGVDSATQAVDRVVNAVLAAGKSLAHAVAAAASFTVDQVTNLVRALIAGGKRVADILDAAMSGNVLSKFVKGLYKAGRAVGEFITWGLQKAINILNNVVATLFSVVASVWKFVSWAASQVVDTLGKVLTAILKAGQSVGQIMADAIRLTATLLKKVVSALITIGQAVGQILASVVRVASSIVRTVIEGLLAAGITLVTMVMEICSNVAEAFRKGFFQGLIALGYAVVDLIKVAIMTSLAVAALAFAAILELFGGYRKLTDREKAEARKIFGYSIDLDRVKIAVNSIPSDVINYVNGERPFTTMYLINFASSAHVTIPTLIHELTHVWQAVVAGPIYMVEALHSQMFGRGYTVTEADLDAANGNIRNLEREQQAQVVEYYWRGTYGNETVPFLQKYKALAEDVYRYKTPGWPPKIRLPIPVPVIGRNVPKKFHINFDN